MKTTWIAAAATLGFLFSGPGAALSQKPEIEVTVKDKRIADPTPKGLTMAFHLKLRNTAAAPRLLVKYDYRVIIDQTEYLTLQSDLETPIRIDPNGETVITLPVKLSYEYLFPAVPDLEDKDLAVCYVAGGMTFRDERGRDRRQPVAFSGDVPIYRGLSVRPAGIIARSLTIGGGEIMAGIVLGNPNGFAFTVERLTYAMEIVGRKVDEGALGGGTPVPGKGEAAFEVPLLLDFFETGRPVYDGLVQPPVDVRVSGEVEILTPWGPWRIPFDTTAKVPVRSGRPGPGLRTSS